LIAKGDILLPFYFVFLLFNLIETFISHLFLCFCDLSEVIFDHLVHFFRLIFQINGFFERASVFPQRLLSLFIS